MATTLKEILDELKPEEQRALLYAFENDLTHYVPIDGDRFIGVNTDNIKFLEADPIFTRNSWRVGCIIHQPL